MSKNIRNFSIIAHIDHGKSTLADRLIETTGMVTHREMKEQILDTMDIERERGITIKSQTVRLNYHAEDGHEYILNLIDTPGHVDFTYEVSRSLTACEGAVLVIDAAQGVEAQTIANLDLALENNLEIIPLINKIDLPSIDLDMVMHQLKDFIGLDPKEVIMASAKSGIGIKELLEAIVHRIPPPRGEHVAPLRALIFDSAYDKYRGVVTYVRVFDGTLHVGDKIRFMMSGSEYEVTEVGYFTPKMTPVKALKTGEVGYIIGNVKDIASVRVGDTITNSKKPAETALAGYKDAQPVVFAGLFPVRSEEYTDLKMAFDKLKLNDASLFIEPETSTALGFGFRCGFLGMLHMEIIQERFEREYGLDLITTAPSVVYKVILNDNTILMIDNPNDMPSQNEYQFIEEPYVLGRTIVPSNYIGPVMKLFQNKKGSQVKMEYISETRAMLTYEFPLNEIIVDFYDKLKSISQGYASFDYEFIGYRRAKLVKLNIMINGDPVDALSIITNQDDAIRKGRQLAERLRKLIPRQMFEVAIQAAIGNKILVRETVKALRKNVTAKCYGGDITRKRKLLEKQKEGKKKMKQIGRVEIPQEAFMSVLQVDEDSN